MKRHRIVIVGGGFAGVWAALGASARLRSERAESRATITLVSPDDALVIRPRLYEADLAGVRVPLNRVLSPLGIEQRVASVETIDTDRRSLTLVGERPDAGELPYDQLVLCAGSRLTLPQHFEKVHCADSYEQAIALHQAVAALGENPAKQFSATVVGGGFTGLELAAELTAMLRDAALAADGDPSDVRVDLVEQAPSVAPEFGARARAVIASALQSLGVQTHAGVPVSQVDDSGVTLADGKRIASAITVCATGPRATALNEQLGLPLDEQGRVAVDAHMASGIDGVWVAGDSARVTVDGEHLALMSCQHAMPQGRQAGANAAAAAIGRSLGEYSQPMYLTCLDLGAAGALLTCGFERDFILAAGEQAKPFKRFINRSNIYPPADNPSGLLKLGKTGPPGALTAAIQTRALRSKAVRKAVTGGGEDRAAIYASVDAS
jgi:NADH dehydrogenase